MNLTIILHNKIQENTTSNKITQEVKIRISSAIKHKLMIIFKVVTRYIYVITFIRSHKSQLIIENSSTQNIVTN